VIIGVAVSVGLLLFASELFFTRAATRELVQQNARSYAADGRALETAYREGSDVEDAVDDVLDLVDSMEDRYGIVSAKLFDADGNAVVAPRDAHLTSERGLPPARHKGPSVADVDVREEGKQFEFVVPVHLGGEKFFLRVNEDGELLHTRIAAVSNEALVFSLVSLLVGMGVFYVIGGRTLARRHSLVVRRAARDPLTDLGNHRSFQDELARAVAVATRKAESLAVVLVDLDKFKAVNDRHGHRRGDELLKEVARALDDGRGNDRAFRIGGDEFALLLPGLESAAARTAVQRRLDAAHASDAAASFTAGIAVLAPGLEADPAALWEQADAALYEGKRSGCGGVVVFDDVAEQLSIVTPAKTQALGALLDGKRLEIAFQPIWDLHDGRMLGVEALARPWEGYGFDGPAEMFAVAEKVGRAPELDDLCRLAALERASELPSDVLLFLNVNPQALAHGMLVGDAFVRAVASAGLDPGRVVLEITERSEARLSQVVAEATCLHGLGFRLALDDVGAGNAGLEMLRHLPVDFVKIDRSVIAAAAEDTHSQAVLLAIIAYARRADAYVIAEGIETREMLSFVRNVDELHNVQDPPIKGAQGFLLGRPSTRVAQLITSLAIGFAGRRRNGRNRRRPEAVDGRRAS
jgi:diguanylate cyclase (GGDEF)-like protein